MALGVLRALHEAGRNVPGEISVVGFDDNPESAEYWPPLTTVRQNFAEVGQRAFALLNQAIQRETVDPGLRLIDNELVVRASTGAYGNPGLTPARRGYSSVGYGRSTTRFFMTSVDWNR